MNSEMKPKTVVVYFSATGTTERVAKMISIATGGKLHEIQPEKKYSAADLDWTVKTSRCCREKDDPESRPAILKNNEDINNYDIIYLGYPIWWNMAPRIINSFIESCNLEGKTVISFCTSGGSGIDNSVRLLKNYYPDANWRAGKILNGNTQREIDEWISCK